jgi:hypothetical protein
MAEEWSDDASGEVQHGMAQAQDFYSHGGALSTGRLSHPSSSSSILKRHTWTAEEDRRLRDLVDHYGPRKWATISTNFKNRNAKQCHQRCVPCRAPPPRLPGA